MTANTRTFGLTKCPECQIEFAKPARNTRYCSTFCRKAFNNRRATRGAAIYDMLMTARYDRERFQKLSDKHFEGKAWSSILCDMAMMWRVEDTCADRDSSAWNDPQEWILDNAARLSSDILVRGNSK